jgi:hypothetical protein
MEDDLNFLAQSKTTSTFQQNGRQPQFFVRMEDNLNFLAKWKTSSISR